MWSSRWSIWSSSCMWWSMRFGCCWIGSGCISVDCGRMWTGASSCVHGWVWASMSGEIARCRESVISSRRATAMFMSICSSQPTWMICWRLCSGSVVSLQRSSCFASLDTLDDCQFLVMHSTMPVTISSRLPCVLQWCSLDLSFCSIFCSCRKSGLVPVFFKRHRCSSRWSWWNSMHQRFYLRMRCWDPAVSPYLSYSWCLLAWRCSFRLSMIVSEAFAPMIDWRRMKTVIYSPLSGIDFNYGQVVAPRLSKFFHFNLFLLGLRQLSEEDLREERDKHMRSEYYDPVERFPDRIDQLLEGLNRVSVTHMHVSEERNQPLPFDLDLPRSTNTRIQSQRHRS